MVDEFKDSGYWALVLGGSSGLGLATAKKLAKHGINICLVHRDLRSQMENIEKEFDAIRQCGVSLLSFNADALKAEKREVITAELKVALGQNGKVRMLVHSIARGNLKPMVSGDGSPLTNDDLNQTINAMAISLYDWTKAVYDQGLFASDARIVAFTSEGNSKVWKNYGAVSAAKATLEAIMRNIAVEFAPYGIRANCIQAGVTETPSFRMIPGSKTIRELTEKRNPFGRLTTAEDVANVVYLMSRDEASWINGSVIIADGGEHLS